MLTMSTEVVNKRIALRCMQTRQC